MTACPHALALALQALGIGSGEDGKQVFKLQWPYISKRNALDENFIMQYK